MDVRFAISSLTAGAGFFGRLPLYLLRRLSPDQVRARIAERLQSRNERFLNRLRNDVYSHPEGVYYALLRHAGCEYGDIAAEVHANGIESALRMLFRAGVWISVDEFKGRKPVIRGTLHIEAGPERLRSPRASHHVTGSSGGSRSSGTPVLFDLRFVRDCATILATILWTRGGQNWVKADWESPGGGARYRLIQLATFGSPPEAWFSQIHPEDPVVPATARWNTKAMRLGGAVVGRPFPAPVHAPLSDPAAVVAWASRVLASGRTPFLFTFPSSAVRCCLAAMDKGIDIAGTRFEMSGEPITAACLATLAAAGCEAIPRYGSMEVGGIGYGCLNPEHSDDLHVLRDMLALIQAGPDGAGADLPERALLITSLHPHSPFLFINASMGDEACIVERDCGCALQAVGWGPHVHSIRSFEKLTTLGVTFPSDELISVLERMLPERLGGAPTSYQLVEFENGNGEPRLELRVHPTVGPLDDEAILREFCSAVETISSSSAARVRLWRDAQVLRVARQPPVTSRVGKILHIHRMGALS